MEGTERGGMNEDGSGWNPKPWGEEEEQISGSEVLYSNEKTSLLLQLEDR